MAYINGEKNGIIKEYEEDNLVFEGECINGEKNGKAKEFYIVEKYHSKVNIKMEKDGKGKCIILMVL